MSQPLGPNVADEEMVARYVLSHGFLYKDNRAGSPLRPNAFLPHRGEVSVFRVDGLGEVERIGIGADIAFERERKHRESELAKGHSYPEEKCTFRYLGRGELVAYDVRTNGLDVIAKEPPERHANILGWPQGSGKKADVAAQLLLAIKLLEKTSFVAP